MRSLLVISVLLFAVTAEAAPIRRLFQDVKLPTQAVLEHETIVDPILADTDYAIETHAGATSAAAVSITTFAHQPDVARNLTITPTGTTADVKGCTITVSGTNVFGVAITEAFVIPDNHAAAVVGAKAFKTVTSVSFPADCEEDTFAATWIVGVGSKLGLNRCTANAGAYAFSVFDGAYESTRGTLAADADEVEKNTFTANGTMNGAKDVELYYVQNFACFQ